MLTEFMIVGAAAAIGAGVAAVWTVNSGDDDEAEKASPSKSDLKKKEANLTRQKSRRMHSELRRLSERYPASGRRVSKVSWKKAVAVAADIDSAADMDKALEFFLPKDGTTETETEVVDINRRVTNLKNLKVDIKKTVSRLCRHDGELQQPNN